MIYFVQRPDGGPIKIGTTIRLSERLKQLGAVYGDLRVVAVIDGGILQERSLHRRFIQLRITGEWFKAGDNLIEFIMREGRPWDGSDERPISDRRPNGKVALGTRKMNQLLIRLTDEERAAFDAAAADEGKSTSAWARDLLMKAATKGRKKE